MQTTVQSDASAGHLSAVHLTFVRLIVIAKSIEQLWCVLELMLVIHCGDVTFKNSYFYSPPTSHQCSVLSLSPLPSYPPPPPLSLLILLSILYPSSSYASSPSVSLLSLLPIPSPISPTSYTPLITFFPHTHTHTHTVTHAHIHTHTHCHHCFIQNHIC